MPDRAPTRPERPVPIPLRRVGQWLAETGHEVLELRQSDPDLYVTGVSLSSDRVRPGDLYAALPGARVHGAAYVGAAREAGAVAVLTDPVGADTCETVGLPIVVVAEPRRSLGRLAAHLYGDPADLLHLIAVTGTQGKTTTSRLAEGTLTAAGRRAAVIGTVGTRVGGVEVATRLTTPEAPDLHGLLAAMVEQDVQTVVMEVSSHALVMGRVDGTVFDLACFTNLGRDHLDFHADVEDYYAAKASLFTPERARRALVNVEDPHGRRLAQETVLPVRTFAATPVPPGAEPVADWWVDDVVPGPAGTTFRLHGPGGPGGPGGARGPGGLPGAPGETVVVAEVPIPGDFNLANAVCALAALAETGHDLATVAPAMVGSGSVPGRLEPVDAGQDFAALVDYAHKPDAVAALLGSLRPTTAGRLLVVLGAGGDRDPGKRPLMGEVAARGADVLVVTDDNPRTEPPEAIRAAVLAGVPVDGTTALAEVHDVADRRDAIRLAVSMAAPGDVLVVAGKGHETGQEIGGVVHAFDDRVVLREELEARVSVS